MIELLDMGGYGLYVWSSFLVSFIGILLIYVFAFRYEKQCRKNIILWQQRNQQLNKEVPLKQNRAQLRGFMFVFLLVIAAIVVIFAFGFFAKVLIVKGMLG